MDEQNPNESQPKARRTKSYDAEQPQPSVMGAESAHHSEGPENVSEELSHAGEQVSRATNKEISNVENALPWPFQATQHALEWTHFFGRATERNFRATDDLSECHSITSLLRWQGDLIRNNVADWLQTSFSVFSISARKFFPHQTQ